MDSLDLQVLTRADQWLANGHQVLLVTVVRTWGSSPRPVGALLALRDDGHAVGSVSGGCIEDDLMHQLRHEGMPSGPHLARYGIDADEARRFGLPCGGSMQMVIEPLSDRHALTPLLEQLGTGALLARSVDLRTGQTSLAPAISGQVLAFDGDVLVSVFGPRYRLLLIGAGQLSASLARMAIGLDFAVTVCDPREEYYAEWAEAGTVLTREMPDDVVAAMRPDARTAVIALTHDPKLDDLALMEALRSPAFYVAALGSRRNNAARRERLLEFDLNEAQVSRLYGPAGLYIGSRTPAEIAVSIAAELVAVRNGIAVAGANVADAKDALQVPGDAESLCVVT